MHRRMRRTGLRRGLAGDGRVGRTFISCLGRAPAVQGGILVLDPAQTIGKFDRILNVIDGRSFTTRLFLIISVPLLAFRYERRTCAVLAAAVANQVLIQRPLVLWRQVLIEPQVLLLEQFHLLIAALLHGLCSGLLGFG